MKKISPEQKCPKCNERFSKLARFCPACGQKVGMGVRSPNEIRALVTKIKRTEPDISDPAKAQWYLTVMTTAINVMNWVTGEEDDDILSQAQKRMEEK